MAMSHATSGDLIPALPLGEALHHTPSHALVKGQHLEVIRLVLPQGKSMPAHHVPGEVTVLCIEGLIELSGSGSAQTMRAGDLVYLAAAEPHALKALQDASAIVTICLSSALAAARP